MAKSDVMMLSKNFESAKARFPGYVSEKFDGVPGGYTRNKLISRQNKPLPGVQWVHDRIAKYIPQGMQIWAEHYEIGKPFKYISGKVRKNEPYTDVRVIIFNAFDMFNPRKPFFERQDFITQWLLDLWEAEPDLVNHVTHATQHYVLDEAHMRSKWQEMVDCAARVPRPEFEGCMYHYAHGLYELKRSFDSMKLVSKVAYDLSFSHCDEATSSIGVALGMAGKLYFKDSTGRVFGCGPGKLTHVERRAVFSNPENYVGRIGVIKAKKDQSYNELREPTFQHWHEDKTEPDEV